ncbi:hypothetical protein Taro_019942 [Colocasia esculenta]|uniref:DUF3598 domain-containing protein n=1 Tax=Colocasia esculenta TaxID=4460 RepID=A0A843V0N9_COLES|nr:hypothetical protein [Colocasia esculenta]
MASLSPVAAGIPEAARGHRNPSTTRLATTHPRRLPAASRPKVATFVGSCESKARLRPRRWRLGASGSPSSVAECGEEDEGSMSIDLLRRFVDLNVGRWNGSFYQFDAHGNLLQSVATRLSASSYGEGELINLIQSLYIKQAPSRMFVSDHDDEPEWVEYKIKETNMFTVDKYQQIGLFPDEKAFSLRYETVGMLETVLRAGVLGEDDTGEECPRNLELPSRRPSLVCENCLYSMEKDTRARAFHIMDPHGFLQMLLIFMEERGGDVSLISLGDCLKDETNRLTSLLGRWEGRSVTKRTGVYGATLAEADIISLLEVDDKGQLIQDITSTTKGSNTSTNVHWTGMISNNMVTFERGYQMTLLPGGMYMGCPSDIAKVVSRLQPFHLEFCWMESPDKRQRLVRTYDAEGLAVSSTYILETKVQGM